jgi:hypothetical protein
MPGTTMTELCTNVVAHSSACLSVGKTTIDENKRMALNLLADLWNAFADRRHFLSEHDAVAEFDELYSIHSQVFSSVGETFS